MGAARAISEFSSSSFVTAGNGFGRILAGRSVTNGDVTETASRPLFYPESKVTADVATPGRRQTKKDRKAARKGRNRMQFAADSLSMFGLSLMNCGMGEAIAELFGSLAIGRRQRVAFINAHCVNVMVGDESYRKALQTADWLLPDGSGVAISALMHGQNLHSNLNGTDLFPELCREAAAWGKSVFLLGARPGIAQKTADAACELAPGLEIAGVRDGYFTDAEESDVIDEINRSGADILLVAFGVPRQDRWLAEHFHRLKPGLVMGVGGLFDFYSGRIPRAPKAIRKAGMEWAWRLAQEPARLARRYLAGNPAFLARSARASLSDAWQGFVSACDGPAKRGLDILGAGLGLVCLAPVFAGIALAIRLESKGPAFFRQIRVGEDGEEFEMLKFRSMYLDAEERRKAVLAENTPKDGVRFKMKKDPRITRIGRLIRRASIDELPQLVNVLSGKMSLVGPRPALPSEVALYSDHDRRRLEGKPGITCIWQISGRADIPFPEQVNMDIAYLENRNFGLDLLILGLTVPAVVSGKGAY